MNNAFFSLSDPTTLIVPVLIVIGIILAIIFNVKHRNRLKNDPNLSVISYLGGERSAGVLIRKVLNPAQGDSLEPSPFGNGGMAYIHAGRVTMEVENITATALLKSTTYTFHGISTQTFDVEPGKRYTMKFDENMGGFYLK